MRAYPADVFMEPPRGEHGQTLDACSARALRGILPNIARDIRSLSVTSSLERALNTARLEQMNCVGRMWKDFGKESQKFSNVFDAERRDLEAKLKEQPK